jgi:YfiH family protein
VSADEVAAPPEADAGIASQPGTVCAIMIADCLPVLLTDRAGTRVAAAHAGWRGLSGGVIENTVDALREAGADAAELMAYLGPAIGPAAFEVGADVRDAFVSRDPEAALAFQAHRPQKWLADLFMLARQALAHAGVSAVYGGGQCTFSDPARFFSYRRDKTTGRMAALIWREN